MRFVGLLRANVLRNKRRTVLTLLSVAIAMFLFVTLRTVITSFQAAVDFADVNRLVVRNASGIIFDLPIAYRERIVSVPGVTAVTWANWFGGIYIDQRNFFARFAVDADRAAGRCGIELMRARAASIGARLRIDSSPGQGTRVAVRAR